MQSDSGWAKSSNINNGAYEIDEAPPGKLKITVQTFAPSPAVVRPDTPPTEIKIPSLKFIPVPAQYTAFTSTPLSVEIKPGPQSHDIKLTQ